MTWWLLNSSRLALEKACIAELEAAVDWLQLKSWRATPDLLMCVEFQIIHGQKEFDLVMEYPSVFPDSPPMIRTRDGSQISHHQYGAEGELCLEHRPDNWLPSITGADMVSSCQRLLAEENPEDGERVHARSAHVASTGRDFRSKHLRFLATSADIAALDDLPEFSMETLALRDRFAGTVLIASTIRLGEKEAARYETDLILPKAGREESGIAVRVPSAGMIGATSQEALHKALTDTGLGDLASTLMDSGDDTHLLIGNAGNWELYWIYGEPNSRKVTLYKTMRVPEDAPRLPADYLALCDLKIGVVGCGSLGSKIAASLCRSGIGAFLLIDEDIFFPHNVVRNELTLTDTGAHKSVSLKNRLLEINPLCDVTALRMQLGGQESAASMAGALEGLGACDLLIDATGEPAAFNMISSVAVRQRKPMVWAEVFAGGIGGFVARARPDIDPVPLEARKQIDIWCEEQGVEWIRPEDEGRYVGQDRDGHPLIADDAEVGVVAGHAARFATDILARLEASIFPVSAYVVGFSSEWLFEQPFDTRPIDLAPEGRWGSISDELSTEEMLKLLQEHLPPKGNDDATASAE